MGSLIILIPPWIGYPCSHPYSSARPIKSNSPEPFSKAFWYWDAGISRECRIDSISVSLLSVHLFHSYPNTGLPTGGGIGLTREKRLAPGELREAPLAWQIEQTMRVDLRPGNTSPSYKGPITGLGNRDNYEDSSLPIPIYRGPPFITFHGWSILWTSSRPDRS